MKTAALLVFLKTLDAQLSPNLYLHEVKCKCKRFLCNHVLIHESVINSFQLTRDEWGGKIKVTSGHRCQMHNREVGGREASFHLIGGAIDIMPAKEDDIQDLFLVAQRHFDQVILYKDKKFLHCHNDILSSGDTPRSEFLQSIPTPHAQ